MQIKRVECEIGGRTLSIEYGRFARQAGGSAWVQYGETIIQVTACMSKHDLDLDFLPLYVDYREKTYAAGKIPGGFFKREGRPSEKETLSCRVIDRSIRPFFPKGFRRDVQVLCSVFSVDQENDSDILCLIGASAALNVSDIDFPEIVSAVRVGKKDGAFVINPTYADLDYSVLDLVVAGTDDSIVMVEGGAEQVVEAEIVEAFDFAAEYIRKINAIQRELRDAVGKPKAEWTPRVVDAELDAAVRSEAQGPLTEANMVPGKEERQAAIDEIKARVKTALAERFPDQEKAIKSVLGDIEKDMVRSLVLDEKRRVDGRSYDEVREISVEVGVLPRTHGSAVFTRGQTQALVVTTLGTAIDEQKIDSTLR